MFKISKIIKIAIYITILSLFLSSCFNMHPNSENILYVYNWGLYIDEEVIDIFERETGIKVVYDMFDTNEEMYTKVKSGNIIYDCACPSDYMIERMAAEGLLHSYNLSDLEYYNNIDNKILELSKSFDYNNTYAVPYVYSTIGISYNKTLLDEKNLSYPKSWNDLWNKEYDGEIMMQDAVRDLLMVGLKKNNYSLNTKNIDEINKACNDLINQKDLSVSYVIDEVRDLMVSGSKSIGVTYSGEMEYMRTSNPDNEYVYVIPSEGTNMTIDSWVIFNNSKNIDAAKKWINFLLRKDISKKNYDYMHYGSPNIKVMEDLSKQELDDESIFPKLDDANLKKYEIYKYLGGDTEDIYLNSWKKIHNS